jgi:uncharacterized protein (DUF58 family)
MRNLLWVIALVLIVLFLLGLITHVLGGLIYILLVVALVFAIIWLVQRINFKKLKNSKKARVYQTALSVTRMVKTHVPTRHLEPSEKNKVSKDLKHRSHLLQWERWLSAGLLTNHGKIKLRRRKI